MRLNEDTVIIGDRVVLVPYEKIHVDKYHKWMADPVLQDLTASEPLTIEEEFEMQREWRVSPEKCTFIVLDRAAFEKGSNNEIDAMVGDVNLFSIPEEDQDSDQPGDQDKTSELSWRVAECEIMIAEETARGKGFGKEAMLLMIKYAIDNFCPKSFVAKIKSTNSKSQTMFINMGFEKHSENTVFQEVTLKASSNQLINSTQNIHLNHKKYSEWKTQPITSS